MKILILGGSGFIGNHLCRRLLNEGNQIICLDNNSTGSLSNIQDLLSNSNFKFISYDVINPFVFECDQIYNLACPASPKAYQADSIKTIKTSLLGTINALDLAKQNNCKILLTSTSEIYGDPLISPQVEEYWGNVNPIGIRSCYDEGKRLAETLMIEYNRNHLIDIRIARIFNTYGPKMDKNDGRVVSNFINQCLENKNITIYGDGSQTRSFCFVDDTVDGLIKLMNSKYIGPINIGNPNEITVKELANIIITMVDDTTSKIIFQDLPQDDPKKRKPDIEKANKYLDWIPITDLKNGLEKTIKFFSNKIN